MNYHIGSRSRRISYTVDRRKAGWIGDTLHGNCLIKHVIEGKIEGRIGDGKTTMKR
jgi:hypothetical protein